MGPADVKELHKAVGRESSRILGNKVSVESLAPRDWESAAVGAECEFELVPVNKAQGEIALRGRGRRRVSVIPLFGADRTDFSAGHCYWVSWYERWKKPGPTAFSLLTASWAVFRGIASYQDKMQLVRVDWDQLCNNVGSLEAGQPHWHFDQALPVDLRPIGAPGSAALQEYPPSHVGATGGGGDAALSIEIGYMHLAMGTWDERQPNPKCWQRHAHRWRDIHCWAIRSLEYIHTQFRNR
jgi:hypothetical protein